MVVMMTIKKNNNDNIHSEGVPGLLVICSVPQLYSLTASTAPDSPPALNSPCTTALQ